MYKKINLILVLLLGVNKFTDAQEIFHHISNTSVYEFMDELANQQIIILNTAIKPYSRLLIATKLSEASQSRNLLTRRQQKELDFYLKDFNKELIMDKRSYKKRYDLFYYRDSLFTLSINPILGIQYWKNENGSAFHRWNGAEAFAYIGPHTGIYGSLRDAYESRFLEQPAFLNQRTGANYKERNKEKGGDFSESRGGIVYSWKWGHAGIIKDHFVWGNNYNGSNIFSGKTPSFAHIKLNMKPVKWFEFNYVHGFLVSNVFYDSTRTYPAGRARRQLYVPKFLAANMFTITPLKKLDVSFGNSIVYSDEFQLGYLVPVYFYKSVDHANSSTGGNFLGQNSQLYLDISSRQIKYIHLYISLFIDEISFSRFGDSAQANFFSAKAGIAVSHPIVPNTTFIAEYTRTNPIVYRHFVTTTTFESNDFNMGHYLKDNAEEIYFGLRVRPLARLYVNGSFTMARKGEDYPYISARALGLPFINATKWKSDVLSLSLKYEIINDGFVFAGADLSKVSGDPAYVNSYTPEIFRGETTTLTAGINIGF